MALRSAVALFCRSCGEAFAHHHQGFPHCPRASSAHATSSACGAPQAVCSSQLSSSHSLQPSLAACTSVAATRPLSSTAAAAASASSSSSSTMASTSGRMLQELPHHQTLQLLVLDVRGGLAVRRTVRPGERVPLPWLSFLFGSGVTALGFAAYESYIEIGKPVPPTMQQLSFPNNHSFLKWPWRSASATGPAMSAGNGDLLLPPQVPSHLPELSRPPLLPACACANSDALPPSSSPSSSSPLASAAAAASLFSSPSPSSPAAAPPSTSSSSSCPSVSGAVSAAGLPLTRSSISEAAARAAPAVVHLVVGSSEVNPSAATLMGPAKSSGSGIIYDPNGYILTNAHVVEAAAGDKLPLIATTQDGRVFRGRVINMDKAADVAVIKVDSPHPLPTASFGPSADLRVGDWVVALGSPLMLRHSVTAGIVSCVERRGAELGLSSARTGYIQTDAAINQGNSGGPLCNLDGQVVGINNMKAVAADGVSFAIPTDAVREIVRQFHQHGRVIRPFIGITMLEVSNGGLRQLKERVPGLPLTSQSAVVIQRVVDGSPAMEAGLESEDVLLSVAGEQHLSMAQVIQKLSAGIGRSIEVQVLRRNEAGEYRTLTRQLTPVEAPQQ